MSLKFQVVAGIVNFRGVEASSPREAIAQVKSRIEKRRHAGHDPEVGMSMVNALDAGTLNFLVFDEYRQNLLAGEEAGIYQEPVSMQLGRVMERHMTRTQLAQCT